MISAEKGGRSVCAFQKEGVFGSNLREVRHKHNLILLLLHPSSAV